MADSYLSITSRSFIVPELGVTLRFESIEPPEEFGRHLSHPQGMDVAEIDAQLEDVCQQIFSVAGANVLSFSR